MDNFVISISRQYGCGAHEIGLKLAKKLNYSYYDKEIIKRAAKDSGFDENIFNFYDEKSSSPSFLFNASLSGISTVDNSLETQVVQFQFDAVKKYANEGNCVIIGRCADYVLRERENLLKIFLHADDDYRIKRVIENEDYIVSKDALKEIRSMDKKRARFHNYYSETKWGDAKEYDLSINVGSIGIDETVNIIYDYIIRKQNINNK